MVTPRDKRDRDPAAWADFTSWSQHFVKTGASVRGGSPTYKHVRFRKNHPFLSQRCQKHDYRTMPTIIEKLNVIVVNVPHFRKESYFR